MDMGSIIVYKLFLYRLICKTLTHFVCLHSIVMVHTATSIQIKPIDAADIEPVQYSSVSPSDNMVQKRATEALDNVAVVIEEWPSFTMMETTGKDANTFVEVTDGTVTITMECGDCDVDSVSLEDQASFNNDVVCKVLPVQEGSSCFDQFDIVWTTGSVVITATRKGNIISVLFQANVIFYYLQL